MIPLNLLLFLLLLRSKICQFRLQYATDERLKQDAGKADKSRKYSKYKEFLRYDKNTFHLPRHHSGYEVHLRMKRSRMGQIAAVRAVGYYGFTTIGDVNVKNVEMSIFLLK